MLVNSQGKVFIPKIWFKNPIIKENEKTIWENSTSLEKVDGILEAKEDENYVIFTIGSGVYNFE